MLNCNELFNFYRRNMDKMSSKEINNTIREMKNIIEMLKKQSVRKNEEWAKCN